MHNEIGISNGQIHILKRLPSHALRPDLTVIVLVLFVVHRASEPSLRQVVAQDVIAITSSKLYF